MKSSLLLLPLLTLASLVAQAQTATPPAAAASAPASDWSITGNAGLFSDYRYRGISQTDKKPAIQGGFDIGHASGFYVGNWNSNIDSTLYNGANIEMDFYGGYKLTAGPVALDFGVLYYYYPGSGTSPAGSTKIDNTELYVSAGFGPVSAKYSQAVSDFFSAPDSKGSWYLEGNGSFEVMTGFSIIGHLGYQKLKGGAQVTEINGTSPVDSITDWKLGVTYDLSGWLLGASYIGTNRDLTGGTAALTTKNISNGTVVVSVSKTF